MALVSLNLRPSKKQLRDFGLIALCMCNLIGLLLLWAGNISPKGVYCAFPGRCYCVYIEPAFHNAHKTGLSGTDDFNVSHWLDRQPSDNGGVLLRNRYADCGVVQGSGTRPALQEIRPAGRLVLDCI